jgi:hypothetical protein
MSSTPSNLIIYPSARYSFFSSPFQNPYAISVKSFNFIVGSPDSYSWINAFSIVIAIPHFDSDEVDQYVIATRSSSMNSNEAFYSNRFSTLVLSG